VLKWAGGEGELKASGFQLVRNVEESRLVQVY
jgi:hypothetical protein